MSQALPPVPEKIMQAAILDYLRRVKHCQVFKFPSVGIFKQKTQSYIPQPFKGIADIIGCTSDGRFIAVEVKKQGNKASPEQLDFLEQIRRRKGIAVLAYSLNDVINAF